MAATTIQQKLNLIQGQLIAPKGQYNSFGKYRYRSCEDILNALKPLLKENQVVVTLSDEVVCVGNRVYVKATATLSDGKESITTTAFAREDENKKGMDGSQVTGASSSYARKYALNGLFAIDDTKDADATNTHGNDVPTAPNVNPQQNKAAQDAYRNEVSKAIAEVQSCKTSQEVSTLWQKYNNLHKEPAFVQIVQATGSTLKTKEHETASNTAA